MNESMPASLATSLCHSRQRVASSLDSFAASTVLVFILRRPVRGLRGGLYGWREEPNCDVDHRAGLLLRASLRRGRVDDGLHFGNPVGGESALLRMLAHHGLVRGAVDAINLVLCYEAFDPLNLWPKVVEHATGFLRDRVQLILRKFACPGYFALNDVFRHKPLRGAGAQANNGQGTLASGASFCLRQSKRTGESVHRCPCGGRPRYSRAFAGKSLPLGDRTGVLTSVESHPAQLRRAALRDKGDRKSLHPACQPQRKFWLPAESGRP